MLKKKLGKGMKIQKHTFFDNVMGFGEDEVLYIKYGVKQETVSEKSR